MAKAATLTNPYVGPRTFSSAERGLFFGRDAEARELLSLVVSQRLLLFYAQSGAGKSSLLNARLMPDLAERDFTVLPIVRVGAEVPRGIEQVDNVFLFSLMLSLDQGGGDPARLAQLSLADFLTGLTSDDGQHYYYADSREGAAEANRVLESTPAGPQPVADQYAEPNFVLIIDQFEEIFTTHLQRWEDRAAFFEQLEQAMKQDPKMWVVLTLREDYVAALDPYAHQLADKLRARYYMQRLGKEAALQAVQNPARLAGRPFDTGVAGQLVDNLSQIQILGEANSWPGQYVEPVQLQVVCYQLWENLKNDPPGLITSANLEAYGNVDNALADFYNRTIKEVVGLPEIQVSELQLRLWFSKQLITEAGTRSIIDQGKETTRGMPNHVVKALADRYLLRAEPRAGAIWIELVHDRFVAPIRRANRDAEAEQKEFEAVENARQEAERQRVQAEIRTSRRLRRLTVALVVVSLVALVAAIMALNSAQSAREKQSEAEVASTRLAGIVVDLQQTADASKGQEVSAQATAKVASTQAAGLQATSASGTRLPPPMATAQAATAQAAATRAGAARAAADLAATQAAAAQAGAAQAAATAQIASAPVVATPTVSPIVRNADGMVMVYVPAGTFKMGSEATDNEKPVHEVTLDSFWIDRTEVTNAQYAMCVAARKCDAPQNVDSATRSPYYGNSKYADYPVAYLSWTDANNYCAWAHVQLPTEAQWEYAARGANDYMYPWGNDPPPNDSLLNYNQIVGDMTRVGAYPQGASWVGALDMAGNVWEWVQDWYGPYPTQAQTNPGGPSSGKNKALRGGSWYYDADYVRTSTRIFRSSDSYTGYFGVRCVAAGPAG